MVDAAKKYPKVEFRHPTSLWSADKHPGNAGGYFCYLDQGHYVNGIAAGLSTKSNKIGYIAAKPIPLVLRNVNSFMLGARKVNPNATVQLIVTGDWALPVREAEAANALVDAGCDVIACHIDSPKVVIETAEKRGVKSCGHNADQANLAPKGFITGAELKWGTIYKSFAGMIGEGREAAQHGDRRLRQGHGGEFAASAPAPPTPPKTPRPPRSPTSRPASRFLRARSRATPEKSSPARTQVFTIPRSKPPITSSRASSARSDRRM